MKDSAAAAAAAPHPLHVVLLCIGRTFSGDLLAFTYRKHACALHPAAVCVCVCHAQFDAITSKGGANYVSNVEKRY